MIDTDHTTLFRAAINNYVAPRTRDLIDAAASIVDQRFETASPSDRATLIAATLISLSLGYHTFEDQ